MRKSRLMVGLVSAVTCLSVGTTAATAATFGGSTSSGAPGVGADYTAAPGEINNVHFSELTIDGLPWVRATETSAGTTLTYNGVPTFAGACVEESSKQVRCPSQFLFGGVGAAGGDRDDSLDAGQIFLYHVSFSGGPGNDELTGGWYINGLAGNDGSDRFATQGFIKGSMLPPVDTTVIGGPGSDTIDYSHTRSPIFFHDGVTVDLTPDPGEASSHGGSDGEDTIREVENVVGTDLGDTIRGDTHANTIIGCGGNDVLEGERSSSDANGQQDVLADWLFTQYCHPSGVNTFNGGPGPDTILPRTTADAIHGGSDTHADTVAYSLVSGGVVLQMHTLPNTQTSFQTGQPGGAIDGIENVIGSPGVDVLVGSPGPNVINGGGQSDFIIGDTGTDILTGGPGTDYLWGSYFSQESSSAINVYFVHDGEADSVDCSLTQTNVKGDVPDPLDTFSNCTF